MGENTGDNTEESVDFYPVKAEPVANQMVRFNLRLSSDVVMRLKYWAGRKNMSVQEYIELAIDRMIDFENGNYSLPSLEIMRLNQLVDEIRAVSKNVENLERSSITMYESLISLTRGDNYLMDEEDGELDE